MNRNITKLQKNNVWKKYSYAIIMASLTLILAIGLLIGNIFSTPITIEVSATEEEVVIFQYPVSNAIISKDYSNTELQYNSTLNQWEIHLGINFTAESTSEVVAVYDGTVVEVSNSYLDGYYVVIEHADGIKTYYKSISADIKVVVGDIVKQGTVIGYVSNSAASECSEAAHLCFQVTVNDVIVNPNDYFSSSK